MMNIFIDTNVIIDLLVKRDGFAASAEVLARAKEKDMKLVVSVLTMANIAYILRKALKGNDLYKELSKLANLFDVADLTKEHLVSTLALEAKDFEEALQYYCACSNECDIIVTRNKKDFAFSKLKVLTPEEFLQKY